MNATMSTYRLRPSKLFVGVLLSLLLASSAVVAVAGSESGAANSYAAAWERYLAAGTPEDLGDFGETWARFWALQNMEPVGAFLVPYEVGGAEMAANPTAAAWQRFLAMENPQSLAPSNYGDTWARFWDSRDLGGAAVAASSPSEGGNRYAAAWERYLAAGTPEDLGDFGATWARFWDTQNMEAVGAFLVPMEVSGEALAENSAFEAANEYAAAWQNFLATQNPQSVELDNWGETWAQFWASVEAGGLVKTEDGFELVCCRYSLDWLLG